jgi:hypothetical protein
MSKRIATAIPTLPSPSLIITLALRPILVLSKLTYPYWLVMWVSGVIWNTSDLPCDLIDGMSGEVNRRNVPVECVRLVRGSFFA